MGYRGEDSSRDRAAWGNQSPRQSSSGQWPASDESWNGTRHAGDSGYADDDNYAGYDGYSGDYDSYSADGPGEYGSARYNGRSGTDGPNTGGYATGSRGTGGYGTAGSGTGGYSTDRYGSGGHPVASGGNTDGYSTARHGTGGYGTESYGTESYGTDRYGSGGYPAIGGRDTGGYPAPGYNSPAPGYNAPAPGYNSAPPSEHERSGGYRALGGPSGGYSTLGGPSGGYPAISSGQDSIPDAYSDGNDWYADGSAAQGAGFADTSTQIAIIRDPIRGYPPEPARPESGVARTGQQLRYDESEYVTYPGYDGVDDNGYGAPRGRVDYDDYAAPRSRDYETRLDQVAIDYDSPRGYGQALQGDDFDGGVYHDDYLDSDDPQARPSRNDRAGGRATRGTGGSSGTGPRKPPRGGGAGPKGVSRKVMLSALALVLVGAAGLGGYKFLMKPKADGNAADIGKPLPTASASSSAATAQCVAQFGQFCHITTRALDPAPLVLSDVYPSAFFSETAKTQFARAAAAEDKDCSKAVIGTTLISQLKKGQCNQVVRATYVSGDGTIMGTIGVINLLSTNDAHHAGKVVGKANFIMPLAGTTGPTAKIGKSTGVVEAEYKGHYLILTWAEFTNQKTPSTTALTQQLESFENALVAGTANIVLSQRMINGDGPAASSTPTATATAK